MGKTTGFMEVSRLENPYRDVSDRIHDFLDLHTQQDRATRQAQASRCMNCGMPYCQSEYGCPLHNLIPEWNDLLYRGQDRQAFLRLMQTAPFPEFTGRVCPALCEKACNLADDGVTNRDNELYLIETGFEKGWVQPFVCESRTGKMVTVIGSGPSGLAAADLLNRLGHSVTVIERANRPGGLLVYGIPNMKLPKEVIERRIQLMQSEGIAFVTGTEADPDDIRADAIVLCGGARKARRLGVENEEAGGVWLAVDYLTEATKGLLDGKPPVITAAGKHTVVVGGGDTGNDCVATALRQGCKSILQIELMPAPPVMRSIRNPWPQWPRILRTDYGQVEAIACQSADPRVFETTIEAIGTGANGQIESVRTVCVMQNEFGRMVPIPGTAKTLPCDLLLIAAGFVGCETATAEAFRVPVNARGVLDAGDHTHHLRDNLFTAGDMHTGQSLVVRAIADGRDAAMEVDAFLRSE